MGARSHAVTLPRLSPGGCAQIGVQSPRIAEGEIRRPDISGFGPEPSRRTRKLTGVTGIEPVAKALEMHVRSLQTEISEWK